MADRCGPAGPGRVSCDHVRCGDASPVHGLQRTSRGHSSRRRAARARFVEPSHSRRPQDGRAGGAGAPTRVQQSNTDQQMSLRNRWSSSTSSRIASGSWSHWHRHSSRAAPSHSPSGASVRTALIAYAAAPSSCAATCGTTPGRQRMRHAVLPHAGLCRGHCMAGRRASLGHLDLATHPGAGMLDGLARSWVLGLIRLEQVKDVFRARCRPQSEELMIRIREGPTAADRHEARVSDLREDHGWPVLSPASANTLWAAHARPARPTQRLQNPVIDPSAARSLSVRLKEPSRKWQLSVRSGVRFGRVAVSTEQEPETAGELIRFWRSRRGLSQQELFPGRERLAKHLSFVETGRSSPSRQLLVHLAQHLDLPIAERNRLLLAGGFAPP